MDAGPILRDIMLGQCADDCLNDVMLDDFIMSSPESSCEQEEVILAKHSTLIRNEDQARASGGKDTTKPNDDLERKLRSRTKKKVRIDVQLGRES